MQRIGELQSNSLDRLDYHMTSDQMRIAIRKSLAAKVEAGPGVQESESSSGRRGYRKEIFAWMSRAEIDTVPLAAKRLGVSESTLKSIMSDKGERKYGQETLDRVLKAIGHPGGESGGE
jgi:hypothetical protein